MGPEGLEPSPAWVRTRDAAANTSIPFRLISVGPEGVEPPSDPYKEPALTVELRAKPSVRPVGFEPTPTWVKARDAAVTPRPQCWSGVSVSIAAKWTSVVSCWFTNSFSVVALGIELSAIWLSAGFGQPALDYRVESGNSGSNRDPPVPKTGVLPSAPLPEYLVSQNGRI